MRLQKLIERLTSKKMPFRNMQLKKIYRALILMKLVGLSCPLLAQTDLDLELLNNAKRFRITSLAKLVPKDPALFAAGEILFSSKLLSGNRNVSCESCHQLDYAGTENLLLSIGQGRSETGQAKGAVLKRHSPALFNVGQAEAKHFFWDRRVRKHFSSNSFVTPEPRLNVAISESDPILSVFKRTVDVQTLFPLLSREEMLGDKKENDLAKLQNNLAIWSAIVDRIRVELPQVSALLIEAFKLQREAQLNIAHVGTALGEFMAYAFIADDTPFDAYLAGDYSALSEQQKFGFQIYLGKGRCVLCHNGPLLSNGVSLNTGVPPIKTSAQNTDFGESDLSGSSWDTGAFKVPSLRNVKYTAPYMHNGVIETLEEVIVHYENVYETLYKYPLRPERLDFYKTKITRVKNQQQLHTLADNVSPLIETPQALTQNERQALLDFIENALSDK